MTEAQRIEAAARKLEPHIWSLDPPDHSSAAARQASLLRARQYAAALYPELHGTPTAWLAPTMYAPDGRRGRKDYQRERDAYLAHQQEEPE